MFNPHHGERQCRLLTLTLKIHSRVHDIETYLSATSQPNLNFIGSAPSVDFSCIDDVRSAVLEDILELQELLMTPREVLVKENATALIPHHFITAHRIAELVPVPEESVGAVWSATTNDNDNPPNTPNPSNAVTYASLSHPMGTPAKLLRRIPRYAMSQRLFYEPQPGWVAHTQASKLLAQDSKVRDYLVWRCRDIWPAATKTVQAIGKVKGDGVEGRSGYFLAHGRTLQESLELFPQKRAEYDNAMGALINDRSFSLEHVIHGYDWAALGKATVVDIGGGIGHVIKVLARAFPLINFIVQDQKAVIDHAVVEQDIEDRVQFMDHDIFAPQPFSGVDVYFMRRVLMEKTKEECVDALKALQPALKEGAVVLIQDPMLPEPGTCPVWMERRFRDSDVLAFALVGSSPREGEE